MQISNNLRGIMCMVLSGLTFVSCDSFLKMLLLHVPPLQSLVLRGIMATVWCFALLVVLRQTKNLRQAFGFWTLMRSIAEVVAVTSFIFALARVPLATVTAIYQVAPLVVLAGASFIWGERVGLARWLLIGFGLVGALLVAQPGGEGASPYALLGFITAFASAGRDLLSRKSPATTPGLVVTFSVIIAVLAASIVNHVSFETWQPVDGRTLAYAVGAGFFVMLGHFFVYLSFRYASARTVAPFYYSFTLMAVVVGAVLFGEYPNALSLLGIAMIITCGMGVLYFERGQEAT
jgi:drug/metabolite transporter (DMT)-like permease